MKKIQRIHLSEIEWANRNIPTTFNFEIDRDLFLDSDYSTLNKIISKHLNKMFNDECINFVAETFL